MKTPHDFEASYNSLTYTQGISEPSRIPTLPLSLDCVKRCSQLRVIANPTQTALSTKERVLLYTNGESSRNVVFRYSLIQGLPLSPGLSNISILLQFCLPLLVFSVLEHFLPGRNMAPESTLHHPEKNRLLLQQGALRVTDWRSCDLMPTAGHTYEFRDYHNCYYQSSSCTKLQAWFFHWLPINGDYIILLYNPIA